MDPQNKAPFIKRFYIYQKERFPFLAHGVMIAAFTFSAVSYSRICRGGTDFIKWSDFLIGIFATITLFFLVRIFDEFKDKEDDAKEYAAPAMTKEKAAIPANQAACPICGKVMTKRGLRNHVKFKHPEHGG